jgi:Ca-activated chloride channel family protein
MQNRSKSQDFSLFVLARPLLCCKESEVRDIACWILIATFLVTIPVVAQDSPAPIFKGGIERVALAAVVRNGKGKLVTDLTARDFELFDSGRRTQVMNVWSESSPASVALLMDASGSMATKLERARETARYLMAGLQVGVDETALYSFDTELTQLQPFSDRFDGSGKAWASTTAFGATSLWDVIAETAKRVAERQRRRALIVLTDGVDSASRMKPSDVSAIASTLDVPVYVVVISILAEGEDPREPMSVQGPLADLAMWTGGDIAVVRDTPSAIAATHQILAELRHQYVIAFEPGSVPGWHPLVLRTKKSGLYVRARSGYMVGH